MFDVIDSKIVLLVLLVAIAVGYIVLWSRSLFSRRNEKLLPTPYQWMVGFITDFLDTIGVGSFATTSAFYRLGKSVDDSNLPGTLNVGHTLPTILQALIYISVIEIDLWTLYLLIIASILGSYMGAKIVSKLPKQKVQLGMGLALLVAVTVIVCKLVGALPGQGEALGLRGSYLILGIIGNFIFGALMTIGIGAYAPIMIMVSLLGMKADSAFPLMMGSCAFLMPVASYEFIKSNRYDPRAALGLTLFGLPAVALAAWFVTMLSKESKNQSVQYLSWLVVIVVIYTALTLLYSSFKKSK
ncbi:MAG: sulfite exporter TauE/SafE family protein [Pirellulales bacterium]